MVDTDVASFDIAGTTPEAFGALASALSAAQSAFPSISRDKTVKVTTKTGGSYTFKYAPLDSILSAVRAPLAANGLAVSQLLDGNDLVTMLLHKDGASLTGRVRLPYSDGETVQALGSAITYLRRYSLQAVLGIAAEEDDDGNSAAGNKAEFGDDIKPTDAANETLSPRGPIERVGAIARGQGRNSDLQWRQTPDGWHIGFLLEVGDGKARPQVVVDGPLATKLYIATEGREILGDKVTVKGDAFEVHVPNRRVFYRIKATDLATADWVLSSEVDKPVAAQPSASSADVSEPATTEAESVPLGLAEDDLSGLPDEWKEPVAS